MAKDENLFWELLEDKDSVTLVIDNDQCYIDDDANEEHYTFDFNPERLAHMLAEKLGITTEPV
jgi:hypothetical protein|tara:strand:+ start:876 stop:1064 length:189 start_codon:yes stop_codon:yes gene_type:complete